MSEARTLAQMLGFHYLPSSDGESRVEVMPLPEHCNERGQVHGGFIAALLDTATGRAMHLALPAGATAPHFGLSVQYLRPAAAGVLLTCVGRAIKAGRRAGATEAEVFQGDALIARGQGSHVVV